MQFHFGDADPHSPAETRAAIAEMAEGNPNLSAYVYPGAAHAFFNAFRPVGFDAEAYETSRRRALDLLRDALMADAGSVRGMK